MNYRTRISILLSFSLIVACLALTGCNDRQPGIVNKTGGLSGPLKFACIRYDSVALEYRLDSIQTRGFTMQFYLPEAAGNNNAFQLISYAFDTLGDYPNSWIPDTLRVDEDSLPKSFEGRIIMGNNEVTREQIYDVLIDKNGKRISYDYVVFSPVLEGIFNHVVYRIKAIKGKTPASGNEGKTQMSSPLPPSRVW